MFDAEKRLGPGVEIVRYFVHGQGITALSMPSTFYTDDSQNEVSYPTLRTGSSMKAL